MTRKTISDAVTNISPEYIEKAADYTKRSRHAPWVRWVAMAACLCLVLTGVFAASRMGLFDNGDISMEGKPQSTERSDKSDDDNRTDNDEVYRDIFTISGGPLELAIYDAYTTDEADVITLAIYECKGISALYFRSSDQLAGQTIRRIATADESQVATCDDGVFTLEFLPGQEFVYLNLYFDAGTFRNTAQTGIGDADQDPIQDDEEQTAVTTVATAVVYFECSTITPEDGYDQISFSRPLAAISDEPKVSIYGQADSLAQAINAVGLQAVLLFEEYTPTYIGYSKTNEMAQVTYQYGLNATVTVRAYEYYNIHYTLDTFVASTGVFETDLYPLETRTQRSDGIPFDIYSCYKNDEDWRSEIAVVNYTNEDCNIFFVIQFELYGENVDQNVKLLVEQMTLVD